MSLKIPPYALRPYHDAVVDAIQDADYDCYDTSVRRTKSGLVAVKAEVRTYVSEKDTRGDTQCVSRNKDMWDAVCSNLASEGYDVDRVRPSHFKWPQGGMTEDAVTFYFKPKK
jgi:hypothetical protein